ncbi:MAG: glycosyltransferase family 4 protein [Chloroflexi bacterium]|nr:glycosyltransferase family 4 protein [Chloroflexota bacterium]
MAEALDTNRITHAEGVDPGDRGDHVAILLLAPFASGAEHQTLALCRYLQDRFRVTLLTSDEFAGLLATDPFLKAYAAGLTVLPLGRVFPASRAGSPHGALERARLYPRLQLALWRTLRRLNVTLIHLILAPSFFAYAPLFHLLPLPVVLTLSGEMRYVRYFYGPAKRIAVRHAVACADHLVVCSADELANLEAVAPRALARATVLDNFTDVARFSPAPAKEPRVTFAARLHPEKGALLFLGAIARVHRAYPDARFALMGKGEQEREVDRRIAELGLAGCVERGFASDLAPLFARSTIFVSCQRHENLGSSSLLEAMAAGNAIVATDVGSTASIVDSSVGIRVPVDPAAIAAAIAALLADPARTAALGRAARQRVLERYEPQTYVERLMRVYAAASHRTCVPARAAAMLGTDGVTGETAGERAR